MLETLIKNKQVFIEYNKYRLKRAFEVMPKMTSYVLRSLPFLLHVNHKSFPGYIDNPATPCGINLFRMTPKTQDALAILFPNAKDLINNPRPLMPKRLFIRSLLLMGSIGTIAQTKKSDFDFWVCINEDTFKPAWMERFLEKLRLIEKWAEKEYDVEVHFFPTDIKKVQENNFGESDKESAGSSQAKLLKEEFYRTMILLVGKIPVWWIIPPGADDTEYNKLKAIIPTSEHLGKDNFIDLGNLYQISYEEFFGAALWQMNKAMDSPFKSVLKMGMLEGYIGVKGTPALLCTELKRRVFNAEGGPYDPYMEMFNHILKYYKDIGNEDVLDLLCKCFYIKIGEKTTLDMVNKDKLNFKEKAVLNYVQKWGWNQTKLSSLNNYKDWSFNKVLELGGDVHNYMVKTYQSLADRLKEEESSGQQIITEKDLTILGRKLFSFYSKKPNKIENLRKAFDEGLVQDDLTFHTTFDKSRRIVWNLYRDQLARTSIEKSDVSNKLLRKNYDLIEMIVWMVYNKICNRKTSFYLTPNPTGVVLGDIQMLVKELYDFFPDLKISTLNNQELLSRDKKKKIYVILNFFSDRSKWDVESVALCYLTTWGEMFYESFPTPKAGIDKVCEYIKEHYEKNVSNLPNHFRIFIPKGLQSEAISKQVHMLIGKKAGPVPRLDK